MLPPATPSARPFRNRIPFRNKVSILRAASNGYVGSLSVLPRTLAVLSDPTTDIRYLGEPESLASESAGQPLSRALHKALFNPWTPLVNSTKAKYRGVYVWTRRLKGPVVNRRERTDFFWPATTRGTAFSVYSRR